MNKKCGALQQVSGFLDANSFKMKKPGAINKFFKS